MILTCMTRIIPPATFTFPIYFSAMKATTASHMRNITKRRGDIAGGRLGANRRHQLWSSRAQGRQGFVTTTMFMKTRAADMSSLSTAP
jgi:hypothetical protein